MKLVKFIEYLRNHQKQLVWLSLGVLMLLIAIDAIPGLVDKPHAQTKIEHIEHLPGFWSVFGFVACALIVLVSKWLGHLFLMKREDYYDE